MIDAPAMIAALLAALAVAGLGFALRRTAPPVARWFGFALAVGFLVVAALAPQPRVLTIAPRVSSATLDGDAAQAAASALRAAARSGPRGVELTLRWAPAASQALAGQPLPDAALGAVATAPPPLPFEPDQLRLRCIGESAVGRPLQLELSSPPLPAPLGAELLVQVGGDEVLRQPVELGAVAAAAGFVPQRSGAHAVVLRCAVDGHEVLWRGAFDVAPADEVLVVERGDVVAAALRAQGLQVRAVPSLPGSLDGVGAVVLAAPLAGAAQELLVTALRDGLGLFVLGAAFGDEAAPLRAVLPVLPVRPLPVDDGIGENATGAGQRTETPPPDRPQPEREPPPTPRDGPIGETGERGPVSEDLVDVDKHSVALVLVVDRSASMGMLLANGYSKMSYAKTSALRTALALAVGDQVGIVTFGNKDAGRVELPMTDATATAAVRAGIEKLRQAPEHTYLLSGLRLARQLLAGQRAAVKHVVIVTDGEFVLDEALGLSAEARHMVAQDHATVSMISIVDGSTDRTFLREAEKLTSAGGGQFLPLTDPAVVPAMVSAEVTRALSKVGRKPRDGDGNSPPDETAPPPEPKPPEPKPPEPEPKPPEPEPSPPEPPAEDATLPVHAVAESPLLAPDPGEWPRVAGLRRCEAPLDARVLLVAGDDGWPLLAYANRGLGRIGALCADVTAAGMPLRDDANFPAWLAQWVRAVAPSRSGIEARRIDVAAEVAPPAPTTHDLDWLTATAGAAVGDASADVAPVRGADAAPQVATFAGWLLLALVLLAIVERAAVVWSVRRGRAV